MSLQLFWLGVFEVGVPADVGALFELLSLSLTVRLRFLSLLALPLPEPELSGGSPPPLFELLLRLPIRLFAENDC